MTVLKSQIRRFSKRKIFNLSYALDVQGKSVNQFNLPVSCVTFRNMMKLSKERNRVL